MPSKLYFAGPCPPAPTGIHMAVTTLRSSVKEEIVIAVMTAMRCAERQLPAMLFFRLLSWEYSAECEESGPTRTLGV